MTRIVNHLLALAILSAAIAIGGAGTARADYRLQPGDMLGISILGEPSLARDIVIDTDGVAHVPLIGDIAAAGKKVSDVRKEIVSRYGQTAFRARGADGREALAGPEPAAILVEIAAYRPVYVMGDVERAGEVLFRPGMTVLQAIASAGGLRSIQSDTTNPESTAIRLQTRVEVLRQQVAAKQSTLSRLRADFNNMTGSVPDGEGPAGLEGSASGNWTEIRKTARSLRDEQTEATIEKLENRLDVLKEQEKGAQESVALDMEQVTRLDRLSDQGYTTAKPLLDARQALLLSTGRALEISAERSNLEVDLTRLSLTDDIVDQVELASLLERMEATEADLEKARLELRGAMGELTQLFPGSVFMLGKPVIDITRQGNGLSEIPGADPGTPIEPGDVISVRVPLPLDDYVDAGGPTN